MRNSKYWDDFERRIAETVDCIRNGQPIPVRRVSCFVTDKCNFRCRYCNMDFGIREMSELKFDEIISKHGKDAIIHITGGEPSMVKWLYPYIDSHEGVRFHLNTNAYLKPPTNIQRLKVSLDTHDESVFDRLVGVTGAFKNVVDNIKEMSEKTVTTVTCVLSRQTYRNAPEFMKFCRETFPGLYAVFFSCYKGNNPEFMMTGKDADRFFNVVRWDLEREMDEESKGLFTETIDEKFRLFGRKRFPENITGNKCWLSMSERVFDYYDKEHYCSHLYRDKTQKNDGYVQATCESGCNLRLVKFNQEVEKRLKMTNDNEM